MPDPHEAQQPEALGKTFGDAAAEDEELAEEIAQEARVGDSAAFSGARSRRAPG